MTDTQLTQPLPEWAPAPEKKRRRAWPWIVSIVVVLGLAVAAWFIGETVARDTVVKTIREQVITQLALPADQQVDVTVEGLVLPQLIAGKLNDVSIASDDVPLGELTGDVTVHAQGIPIRGDAPADAATATVRLDETELQTLLGTVEGFPVDTVGLAAPDITASTSLAIFGVSFPVGIALTPTAVDGAIVLTPSSLQLAGATVTADELRERFGNLADLVVKDYTVCIAKYVPAGVRLTDLSVEGDQVVADFDIDGAIVTDPALQADGTCA